MDHSSEVSVTKRLWIYIDETGNFIDGLGKRNTKSGVGGIASYLNPNECEDLLRSIILQFQSRGDFRYPDDLHANVVREPLNARTSSQRTRLAAIDRATRDDFISVVAKAAEEGALFKFIAWNYAGRLYFNSREATYQIVLNSSLRTAVRELAERGGAQHPLAVVIAQRTAEDTYPGYSQLVAENLQKEFLKWFGEEPQLSCWSGPSKFGISSSVATRHAGLMLADFVLWAARSKGHAATSMIEAPRKPAVTAEFFDHYILEQCQAFERQGRPSLMLLFLPTLKDNQTGKQLLKRMMEQFARISSAVELTDELDNVLAECTRLIDRRLSVPDALDRAEHNLGTLRRAAEQALSQGTEDELKHGWAGALLATLEGLLVCANHRGDIASQEEYSAAYEAVSKEYGNFIPGTFSHRSALRLKFTVRRWNRYFNNYDFESVVDRFDATFRSYKASVPVGYKDDLLGEMLGTLGQAYAFIAKTDEGWGETSIDYFEESLQVLTHSEYRAMSINFGATLFWQKGSSELARAWMSKHSWAGSCLSQDANLDHSVALTAKESRAYDLCNLLRIASLETVLGSGSRLNQSVLDEAARTVESMLDVHPKELLLKWLAFLYCNGGNFGRALRLATASRNVCSSIGGFTIRTISVGALAIEVWCPLMGGNGHMHAIKSRELESTLSALALESQSFARYLFKIGGAEEFSRHLRARNIEGLYRAISLLPFTYA